MRRRRRPDANERAATCDFGRPISQPPPFLSFAAIADADDRSVFPRPTEHSDFRFFVRKRRWLRRICSTHGCDKKDRNKIDSDRDFFVLAWKATQTYNLALKPIQNSVSFYRLLKSKSSTKSGISLIYEVAVHNTVLLLLLNIEANRV